MLSEEEQRRFWGRVSRSSEGCWEWLGPLDAKGYGVHWTGARNVKAHRLSFELTRGALPPELTLDHLCRNKRCVNPDHLEACTAGENAKRAPGAPYNRAREATHCKRGHRLDTRNVRERDGSRRCIRCQAMLSKRAQSEREEGAW